MRKLTTLFVTIGVLAGLTLVAAPVGASVDHGVAAKTSKFCKAMRNVDIPQVSDNPDARQQAQVTAKRLQKVAKKAKGKLKKATLQLASVFEALGNGDSLAGVLDAGYATASVTFTRAALKCLVGGSNLPNITLPDNITLPGQ